MCGGQNGGRGLAPWSVGRNKRATYFAPVSSALSEQRPVPGGKDDLPLGIGKRLQRGMHRSATAASPEFVIASCVGPAPRTRSAASASAKTIRQSISLSSYVVRPALASTSSSLPGSESANMPLPFIVSSASGAKSGNTG